MNGQEFARALFHGVYLPVLEREFPDVLPKLSAGVVGTGSEVLGADDALSRDHGWGPCCCRLFLDEEDIGRHGDAVKAALGRALPPKLHGVRLAEGEANRIPLLTIDQVYIGLTGLPHAPRTMQEWIKAPENGLCYARAGSVIFDPSGALASRKDEFENAYYPECLWRWRLAGQLWAIWHHGSYNLCGRLAERNDALGALVAQGHFVEGLMRLVVLLNRQYAPYWKWLSWTFGRLARLADRVVPHLKELESQSGLPGRSKIIGEICRLMLDVLFEEGLLPKRGWYNFAGAFEVLKGIEDDKVRAAIKEQVPFFFIW